MLNSKRACAGGVAVATNFTVNKACGIPGSGVDVDRRTKFTIDINFNNPAAVAVRSNNR